MRPHTPSLALLSCFSAFLMVKHTTAWAIDRQPMPGELSIAASPNPFNPSTLIRYHLPVFGRVTISIYDVRGKHIDTLVDGIMPAGWHQTQWRGKDQLGRRVASGMYFVTIEKGKTGQALKLVLLK